MRGAGAHAAEIVRRVDDAAAEVILPDAIHHHARGERIVGIGDPLGQFGARSSAVAGSSASLRGSRTPSGRMPTRSPLAGILAARQRCDRRALLRLVRSRCGCEGSGAGILSCSSSICLGRLLPLVERLGVFFPAQLRTSAARTFAISSWTGAAFSFQAACSSGVALATSLLVGRAKEGLQAVVVALADRIELVIVAARAADRDAEEGRADDVGHLGQDFVAAAGDFLIARHSCAADRGG